LRSPTTLCHGDLRLDNLRFDQGQLVVFDFQLLMLANGLTDLAYFMSQSVSTAVRAGRDEEVLARYLDRLSYAGVRIGRDEAWQAYRAATLYMLIFPVVLYEGYEAMDSQARALVDSMLDRSVAAILDVDACGVLEQL
jgi:aminoglycoside phosphotransferase (APT) family kinase protein